jgi:hypothetical protein
MKKQDSLNFAVLKCISGIPLTLEEVQLISSCNDLVLIESAGIDAILLSKVHMWMKHEFRRLSTNFGTTPTPIDGVADLSMNINPYAKSTKSSK